MFILFFFLALFSLIGLIVGLIRPAIFKKVFRAVPGRKKISAVFVGGFFVLFTLSLITAPPVEEKDDITQPVKEMEEVVDNNGIAEQETEQQEEPQLADNAEEAQPAEVDENLNTEETIQDNPPAEENKNQDSAPTVPASEPVPAPEPESENTSDQSFLITRVVDGDTMKVSINGTEDTIRLIGIDTPETVHPSKPVECFGMEASNKAKELLDGKMVKLEADSSQGERDKYGRLLRYIFLQDGTNFNKLMISEGYAYEYTYNLPYKYQAEFKSAEQYAKTNEKGLWAPDACSEEIASQEEPAEPASNFSGTYDCSGNNYNCSDFKTQQESQDAHDYCMIQVGYDIHRLDRDGDGKTCESLP